MSSKPRACSVAKRPRLVHLKDVASCGKRSERRLQFKLTSCSFITRLRQARSYFCDAVIVAGNPISVFWMSPLIRPAKKIAVCNVLRMGPLGPAVEPALYLCRLLIVFFGTQRPVLIARAPFCLPPSPSGPNTPKCGPICIGWHFRKEGATYKGSETSQARPYKHVGHLLVMMLTNPLCATPHI